ncbi:MAG TPA: glycosyltransferase [Thermoanaerobaculia bacterium]|nr:glycosyltransferase [Thermoanaerobaculia bacterium]
MRIGLDFRMLSAGGLTAHRGMGRYTRQQLREVLRIDRRNEYVLFCREDADLPALLPDVAGAPNVSIAWLPPLAGRSWHELNRPQDVLRATDDFQRALDAQDVDVFHLTTPGHLDDLVPFEIDAPLVATHYDLIPLLFPAWYLREPGRRELYLRALRLVCRADRLVAISPHVAREAAARLGVPAARIRVAPPLADPCFRPLPAEERERVLRPLRERLGLPGGFLLTVSHLHYAKNLRGLFDAYALLAPAARRELPLVLACELHPADAATVRDWARERGIEADLRLTGFVPDTELVALYNAATVYVHASLSEGFGLPVLEAMRCGAAVVAADASSLPEVVGDAGLLADPADPAALARAVDELRRDPERRRELGERALERAAGWREEDLGRETLAAYEEARACRERPRAPLRLALWTPVPPQESGIADYSVELLRELVRHAEVEVFVDDGVLPEPEVADLAPVHLFTAFARRDRRRPFDASLYQLGASYFHLYMDEALRLHPSPPAPPAIITLHDLTWGALLYREAALWGNEEELRRALAASEGEGAAAEHAALGAGDPADLPVRMEDFFNRHPLLGGVMAASRAQIVHLPRAAAELAERYPGTRVHEFPMGVEDPRRSLPASADNDLRRRYGIAESAFLIGTFGVADPVKRLDAAVRALARLAAELPEADPVLLIVGGFHDPAYRAHLEGLAAELGLGEKVRVLGRTPRRDFDLALLACDVVVNLRYPFRHQMSATLMRAIAAGRPVVVSDVPSWDHFPESFCVRVAPDAGETEHLARHLFALAGDPVRRQGMGEAARRFWEERATPARMAEGYLRVLSEIIDVSGWRNGESASEMIGESIGEMEEPASMSENAPSGNQLPSSKETKAAAPAPGEAPAEGASPPAPRDDGALAELEMRYRRWDAVRARTALEEASGGGIRGGLGFASRTAARIRNLGISWDLQRDLYRELLDCLADLDQRLRALESREDLAARLEAAEAAIARLASSEADIRGAINEMTREVPETGGEDRGELANLRDRQESLRVRQARLEGELADLRERTTGLASAGVAVPLSPRDFAEILAAIERDLTGGERPGAVEVSIQDIRAEGLLLAARRHFGGRLSSAGPEYRSPNDLWIHVDFTAHWNRSILLENAAARLMPGGRFLLVTAAGTGEPPQQTGLALEDDLALPLAEGGPVRVLAWRKA